MRISIRRAIAALSIAAIGSPLIAADYGYQTPTRLPAVNAGVHQTGYYPTVSPYKTAAAPQNLPAAPESSNIVIQNGPYGSSQVAAHCTSDCDAGCTSTAIGPGNYGGGYADGGGCYGTGQGGYGSDCGGLWGHGGRGMGLGGGVGGGHVGRMLGVGGGYGAGCSQWFASASGLYMDRDDANEIWLSFDDATIDSRVLGTRAAEMDWSGGGEVTFGRYFNCGMNAVEVTYWGVFADTQEVSVFGADQVGNLDTALNYNSVAYDDGGGNSAVNDWYDDAQVHRLRRDYEFHNIELNLIGSACSIPLRATHGSGTLNMSWVAGVRFFKLDEDFQFATDDTNTTFTGEIDELYHNINVENNLVGFQLGADAEYAMSSRFSLTSGVKFGIYGNYMENHQSIVGGTGIFATIDNAASPYDGLDYNFSGSKSRVSFLGEVDLGMRYQATCNWSLRAGWRAMAVSGVALSVHQFPGNFNFEDAVGAADVESNGHMILHGGYLGAEYNY